MTDNGPTPSEPRQMSRPADVASERWAAHKESLAAVNAEAKDALEQANRQSSRLLSEITAALTLSCRRVSFRRWSGLRWTWKVRCWKYRAWRLRNLGKSK